MFNFPELAETRERMLEAFREEQTRTDLPPYRPKGMTQAGEAAFPGFMEAAILHGNELMLKADLDFAPFWYASGAGSNPGPLASRAANSEFNTWYVKGLCLRLLDEGVETCEIIKAQAGADGCRECEQVDGRSMKVTEISEGHRIRYHHLSPDPHAISVPLHTNCHHSIRRLS